MNDSQFSLYKKSLVVVTILAICFTFFYPYYNNALLLVHYSITAICQLIMLRLVKGWMKVVMSIGYIYAVTMAVVYAVLLTGYTHV